MSASQVDLSRADAALIAGIRVGDVAAFGSFVVRFTPAVTTTAYQIVHDIEQARDIAHDVFFWIWENRRTFEVTSSITAYLIVATRRRALNVVRHGRVLDQANREFLIGETLPGMGEAASAPDAILERRELADALQRAIDALPPRARTIAALRWQERMGRKEIADALGITVSTVSNTLMTATRAVRTALARYANDYMNSERGSE